MSRNSSKVPSQWTLEYWLRSSWLRRALRIDLPVVAVAMETSDVTMLPAGGPGPRRIAWCLILGPGGPGSRTGKKRGAPVVRWGPYRRAGITCVGRKAVALTAERRVGAACRSGIVPGTDLAPILPDPGRPSQCPAVVHADIRRV